jgi:hypothetical protein
VTAAAVWASERSVALESPTELAIFARPATPQDTLPKAFGSYPSSGAFLYREVNGVKYALSRYLGRRAGMTFYAVAAKNGEVCLLGKAKFLGQDSTSGHCGPVEQIGKNLITFGTTDSAGRAALVGIAPNNAATVALGRVRSPVTRGIFFVRVPVDRPVRLVARSADGTEVAAQALDFRMDDQD